MLHNLKTLQTKQVAIASKIAENSETKMKDDIVGKIRRLLFAIQYNNKHSSIHRLFQNIEKDLISQISIIKSDQAIAFLTSLLDELNKLKAQAAHFVDITYPEYYHHFYDGMNDDIIQINSSALKNFYLLDRIANLNSIILAILNLITHTNTPYITNSYIAMINQTNTARSA